MKNQVVMSISGLEELRTKLVDVGPRQARNILRATVHAVAGKARDEIRRRAPKDRGVLKSAIKAVRRRGKPDAPVSDVTITKGKGQSAFYWRFVEHGTRNPGYPAQPFVVPAVEELSPKIPAMYREEFGKKYEKALKAKNARR